ncbi:MAG: nucleotidyltransferase family protein [Gemmatimonadaceae bacterium]
MIAALLLAAGSARRFNGPKLLQELEGKPIIRWCAETLRHPLVDEIVVVVPPEHAEIRRSLAGLDVRFVVNPNPNRGMGSSIACGVTALTAHADAVLVALADEPTLNPAVLERVISRSRAGDASIIVPTFRGVRGHPVLFQRSAFEELRALPGDQGARAVTDRHPARVAFLEQQEAKPIDVDTPADLSRLRTQAAGGGSRSAAALLDDFMPEYDVRASYATNVHAPAETVYRAVLETNLADSMIAKVLMVIRSLGRRRHGSFRFGELPSRGSFFLLGQDPPREVVAGVVGKFWSLRSNVGDGDLASFRAPPAPDTAKAAWNFRVERTATGSRLTTETRVLCADDESRRAFRRYWTVVGPFSGVIRMEALRLIRKQAQFMSSI